jgi:hypothetical protein
LQARLCYLEVLVAVKTLSGALVDYKLVAGLEPKHQYMGIGAAVEEHWKAWSADTNMEVASDGDSLAHIDQSRKARVQLSSQVSN